jgi:hypothetical protein
MLGSKLGKKKAFCVPCKSIHIQMELTSSCWVNVRFDDAFAKKLIWCRELQSTTSKVRNSFSHTQTCHKGERKWELWKGMQLRSKGKSLRRVSIHSEGEKWSRMLMQDDNVGKIYGIFKIYKSTGNDAVWEILLTITSFLLVFYFSIWRKKFIQGIKNHGFCFHSPFSVRGV